MKKSGEDIFFKGLYQLNKVFYIKFISFRYTYFIRIPQYSIEEYLSDSILKCNETPPDDYTWQEYFRQRAFQDKHIRLLFNEIISNRTTRKFI